LILHSIATLLEDAPAATVIRLVAPEAGPSAWLRAEPNPIAFVPFKDLVSAVFQEVALAVASAAPLTQLEAERLKTDPTSVRQLLDDGELNASLVDESFRQRIRQICDRDTPADVHLALAALIDQTKADFALEWLSGKELTEEQRTELKATKRRAEAQELAGIIAAAAALHASARRPFALAVDEWEHAGDYDRAQGNADTQEWLKRLLESLAAFPTLVIVAGHSRAWDGQPNLVERFTEKIRMVILSPEWIEKVLEAISGVSLGDFGPQAKAIQEATGGRIRDVLTLSSVLWDESEGFRTRLDPEQIRQRASMPAARAIDEVQGLLQELRYTVQRPGRIADGLEFDLVASKDGRPAVVFEFRHSVTQQFPRQQINRFLEKATNATVVYPHLLTCFVAEGNSDHELKGIAESTVSGRVRYFDTKTPDVIEQIRRALLAVVTPEAGAPISPAEAIMAQARIIDRRLADAAAVKDEPARDKLRDDRLALDRRLEEIQKALADRDAGLDKRLRELESRREREYSDLQARLTSVPDDVGVPVAQAVIQEPDPLETTYFSISAEYAPMRALSHVVGTRAFIGEVVVLAVCLVCIFFASELMGLWLGIPAQLLRERAPTPVVLVRIGGSLLAVVAVLMVLRDLLTVQRFLEHARRLLREVYLKTRSAEALSTADTVLQEVLSAYGARVGMLRAREALAQRFPFLQTWRDAASASA
jgi:hypothetical protein